MIALLTAQKCSSLPHSSARVRGLESGLDLVAWRGGGGARFLEPGVELTHLASCPSCSSLCL